MFLNATSLVERGIVITNGKGAPAQVGYDLTVKDIKQVPHLGSIASNKTAVPKYWSLEMTNNEDVQSGLTPYRYYDHTREQELFFLVQGVYSIEFEQGCRMPNNICGWIKERSSIARIGGLITSGIYDPGFFCDNVGAFLHVNVPQIIVGLGERLAQFVASMSEYSQVYDGQWQGTKDVK